MTADFFDYVCARCEAPVCERVQLMNLALGLVDELACLSCLAREYGRDEPAMARYCWEYIESRDCFLTPWRSANAGDCPRLRESTPACFCQFESDRPIASPSAS